MFSCLMNGPIIDNFGFKEIEPEPLLDMSASPADLQYLFRAVADTKRRVGWDALSMHFVVHKWQHTFALLAIIVHSSWPHTHNSNFTISP